MENNKKNNIIMRKFLQKFVDWIAMLLRWLCIAPNDAVQCQHDTRMEKHRDVDARQERRGLVSSELVKAQRLFAECKSFIRQRFKRMAVGVLLFGTALSASGQDQRNLGFAHGLDGWRLYYGAVLYSNQRKTSSCENIGNGAYAASYDYYWNYQDFLDGYRLRYNTDCPFGSAINAQGQPFKNYFSSIEASGDGYATTSDQFYEISAEDAVKQAYYDKGAQKADENEQYRYHVIAKSGTTSGYGFYSDPNVNHYGTKLVNLIHGESIDLPRVFPGAEHSCRIGACGSRIDNMKMGTSNSEASTNPLSTELAVPSWGRQFEHTAAAEQMLYEFSKTDDDDILMIHFLALAEAPEKNHYGSGAPEFTIGAYSTSDPNVDLGMINVSGSGWNKLTCGDSKMSSFDMTCSRGHNYECERGDGIGKCDHRNLPNTGWFSTGSSPEIRNSESKGWRTLIYPLDALKKGDRIGLQFITRDCNYGSGLKAGGHSCYMYFTCEVKKKSLVATLCDAVNGPLKATATKGYNAYIFGIKTERGFQRLHDEILTNNEFEISKTNEHRAYWRYITSNGSEGTLVCYMASTKGELNKTDSELNSNTDNCIVKAETHFGATAVEGTLVEKWTCPTGSDQADGLSLEGLKLNYTRNNYDTDPITDIQFFVKKGRINGANSYPGVANWTIGGSACNNTVTEEGKKVTMLFNGHRFVEAEAYTEIYTIKAVLTSLAGCVSEIEQEFTPAPALDPKFDITGTCQYGDIRITNESHKSLGSTRYTATYYLNGNRLEDKTDLPALLLSNEVVTESANMAGVNEVYVIAKDENGCTYTSPTASVNLTSSPVVDLYINPDSYKQEIEVKNNITRTVTLEVCPGGKVKVTPFSTDPAASASKYKFQWYDATNAISGTEVLATVGNAGTNSGVYTSGEVELGKGVHTLTVKAEGGCKTTWTVYVQESAGKITLGDIAKVCPGDPLTIDVDGAKSVLSVNFVVEETQGSTPVKTVTDFSWKTSSNQLVISKVVDVSLYASAYQYYYEVEFTNDDNCSEKKTFIPKNLAAPLVTYTVKSGSQEIGKTSSIDPTDNVTLWTTEPVCAGTVLTITLNNASADMTNYYVIKDAEGNSYGPTTSGRFSKSDPYSFQYTVPAVAAGGEVIRFTVKTDGMNGNVAQCAITEKLAIQVKPTVQFDMAASASQITSVSSASLASNEKNTYCDGEKFYFYVRPYNENGELASATVKVQNTALLAQPSTDKETIFNNGTLGYGMSGAQSDALGQYQTLKVSVMDDGCTSEGEYKVYVKPLPVVKTTKVFACPNSTFEVQLGDQGTTNATVNEDNTIAKVDYAFQSTTNGTTTASQQSYDVTSLTQSFTAPTPAEGTTYSVGGVVTAKDGCTAEFTAEVALYPAPSFEAKAVKTDGSDITDVICQGEPYAIKLINTSSTAVVFKVKDNFGNQIGTDINVAAGAERTTNTFVAPNEKTTKEYLISCTTNNGCEGTDAQVSVEVGVKPTLDFAPVAAVCSDPNGGQTPVTVTAAIGATNTANAGTITFDN